MRGGDILPEELASLCRTEALFEQMPIPMLLFDLRGRYLACNRAFTELFGYSHEEMSALSLLELVYPDHRGTAFQEFQFFFEHALESFTTERLYVSRSGLPLEIRLRVARIHQEEGQRDFVAALFENAREIAEERAHREHSEALFRSLFDATPEPMMIVDNEGIVELANPAATMALSKGGRTLAGTVCPCAYEAGKVESFVVSCSSGACEYEVRAVPLNPGPNSAYLVCLRDITHLIRAAEQLRDLCLMDDLTGLYNRRGFLSLARQHLLVANRTQRGVSLVFIDLDDLKVLNDHYGHLEGDRALVRLADVLRKVFRRSDVVARIGGDEFAVLALETHGESVDTIRKRLDEAIEESNRSSNKPWTLSVSCGLIAYDPSRPTDIQTLLQLADQAMYQDKNARHRRADQGTHS